MTSLEDLPRFRTCVHEAGHAVVGAVLGHRVQKVWTNRDGSGGTRWTDPSMPGLVWPGDGLRVALAGGEAERWAFSDVNAAGCWVDEAHALEDAYAIERDIDGALTLIETARDEVRGLLFDHWLEVEGIALALIEQRVLWSEDEVEAARRTYVAPQAARAMTPTGAPKSVATFTLTRTIKTFPSPAQLS